MIEFATLFLGLVLGTKTVAVVVNDSVAGVEIVLDGAPVATLTGEPWTADCDFGDELSPHLLEAVAYDAENRELSRARQWLNLPRPPAEARLLLEPGEAGRGVRARLVWDSLATTEPYLTRITFDGEPLTVDDPSDFVLPPHDPESLHFLEAELEFTDNLSSRVELTFGGTFTDRVDSRQTAVPVLLEGKRKPPPAGELQGSFIKDGEELRVLAIDDGPGEVVIVRDLGAQKALDQLSGRQRRQVVRRGGSLTATEGLRFASRLKKDVQIRFLTPFPQKTRRDGYDLELFPPSPGFTSRDGGFFWALTQIRPAAGRLETQRLADAVAVAGMIAATRDRRRAVVLIVGDRPYDASQLAPSQVRAYLESLHVPLFVWSPEPEITGVREWGEVVDISSTTRLERAVRELGRHLERQRIVWIEGFHLPQRITLTSEVVGVTMPAL
jgi:hypothetical protein